MILKIICSKSSSHLIRSCELDHAAATASAVAGREDISVQHITGLFEMILQFLPSCLPAQISNINSAAWLARASACTRHFSTPIWPFIRQRKIHNYATSAVSLSHLTQRHAIALYFILRSYLTQPTAAHRAAAASQRPPRCSPSQAACTSQIKQAEGSKEVMCVWHCVQPPSSRAMNITEYRF